MNSNGRAGRSELKSPSGVSGVRAERGGEARARGPSRRRWCLSPPAGVSAPAPSVQFYGAAPGAILRRCAGPLPVKEKATDLRPLGPGGSVVGDARLQGGAVDLFLFQRAQQLRRQVQLPHLPFDVGLLGPECPEPGGQLPVPLEAILQVDFSPVSGQEPGDLLPDGPLHGLGLAGRDTSTRARGLARSSLINTRASISAWHEAKN